MDFALWHFFSSNYPIRERKKIKKRREKLASWQADWMLSLPEIT